MVQAISTGTFCEAKWVVDPVAGQGTHTTIASAIASASSGDTIFIRPGTYTENFTVDKSLIFSSFGSLFRETYINVAITGKVTISSNSLTISFFGIRFNTNSDNSILLSGQSNLTFESCYFNASNANSISATGSSSNLHLENCSGNMASTFTLFVATNTLIWIKNSLFLDSAGTLAASSSSASSINLYHSSFVFPFSTSSTGIINAQYCQFGPLSNVTNQTWITTAGNQTNFLEQCQIFSGTSSAISIGAGTTVSCNKSIINSTNTNAITGAGTLLYSSLSFVNSSVMNVTTQTAAYTQLGKSKASGQPAFFAYNSASDLDVTGDGTAYTIIFDTVVYDQDSNYNNGTGVFTAPVTGRYAFTCCVTLLQIGASHTTLNSNFIVSNRNWRIILTNPTVIAVSGNVSYNGACEIDMDANDTCSVQVIVSGSTKTVDVNGDAGVTTAFSGHLIC